MKDAAMQRAGFMIVLVRLTFLLELTATERKGKDGNLRKKAESNLL